MKTSPFKPSLEEYNNYISRKERETLLILSRQAIAWGTPNSISVGMSHTQLVNLIAKLAKYIERNT